MRESSENGQFRVGDRARFPRERVLLPTAVEDIHQHGHARFIVGSDSLFLIIFENATKYNEHSHNGNEVVIFSCNQKNLLSHLNDGTYLQVSPSGTCYCSYVP